MLVDMSGSQIVSIHVNIFVSRNRLMAKKKKVDLASCGSFVQMTNMSKTVKFIQ